jgi:hypothetical protein
MARQSADKLIDFDQTEAVVLRLVEMGLVRL